MKDLKEKGIEKEISSCPHCYCGTHTVEDGTCGKCGKHKAKVGTSTSDTPPDCMPNNMNKLTPKEKEIYKTFFNENEGNGSSRWLVSPDTVERFIEGIKQNAMEKEREKLELNIGMLRQWLNEDRITDIDKLITSEDIKHWIFKEPIDFKDVDLLDKK